MRRNKRNTKRRMKRRKRKKGLRIWLRQHCRKLIDRQLMLKKRRGTVKECSVMMITIMIRIMGMMIK